MEDVDIWTSTAQPGDQPILFGLSPSPNLLRNVVKATHWPGECTTLIPGAQSTSGAETLLHSSPSSWGVLQRTQPCPGMPGDQGSGASAN